MTALYPIARANGRPLARHLPEAPTPKPTMTMAELAAIENKAAGFAPQTMRGVNNGAKNGNAQRILNWLHAHGPLTTRGIAAGTGIDLEKVNNAMHHSKALAERSGFVWVSEKSPGEAGNVKQYRVVKL